jgi:hypothetical protein
MARLARAGLLFAFATLSAASLPAIDAGKAEGTLEVGKQSFKPKYAWAKRLASGNQTNILLSDRPLSQPMLESAGSQFAKMGAQVFAIQLRDDGSFFLYDTASSENLSTFNQDEGNFTFTRVASGDDSIAGRIASKKGLKHDWNFDVTFHAALGEADQWGGNPVVSKEFASRTAALGDSAASGTFTVGKNSIKLVNAYAKGKRFGDGQEVVLFLLDRPVDETQIQNEVLAEEVNGLVMKVASDGKIFSVKWLHPDLNAEDSGFDVAFFEPVVLERDRIEGRVYSLKDAAFRDTKYTYLADFKAPVAKYAKADEFKIDASNGQKLPKGGGEPGRLFMAYDKALRSKDIEKMLAIAGDEAREQFNAMTGGDKARAQEIMEMISELRASKIRIVDGYVDGDRASLYVEGESGMESGAKEQGRVNMIRDGKGWRIAREMWGDVE